MITEDTETAKTQTRQEVEKINVPVTYFYAVPGSIFSPQLAQWYESHVKSEFHSVAFNDSTHMLISDHPEQFSMEVIRVLEKK